MTPDQLEIINDTVTLLIGYDGEDTIEGLKHLIDEARERLEQVLFIQEDERGGHYDGKFKCHD